MKPRRIRDRRTRSECSSPASAAPSSRTDASQAPIRLSRCPSKPSPEPIPLHLRHTRHAPPRYIGRSGRQAHPDRRVSPEIGSFTMNAMGRHPMASALIGCGRSAPSEREHAGTLAHGASRGQAG